MQDFPERLRMFKLNAESVRELDAQRKKEGAQVRLLPSLALHQR